MVIVNNDKNDNKLFPRNTGNAKPPTFLFGKRDKCCICLISKIQYFLYLFKINDLNGWDVKKSSYFWREKIVINLNYRSTPRL